MIGSNMAQTAIMMGLTPNICLYDPYAPGLEGVAEELYHCGFEGVNVTFTSDIKEALTGAKYIVNSGGAAFDYVVVLWLETFTSYYIGCFGLYSSA